MKKTKWIAAFAAMVMATAAFAAGCKNSSDDSDEHVPVPEHIHYYHEGKCTVCGFPKPTLEGGTIDDRGVLTKYEGDAANVVIHEGVTSIGRYAFWNCTSLASVVIPHSMTEIGINAFDGCSPNLEIQYDGTKAQWNAISGSKFKATIQCSDGIVTN